MGIFERYLSFWVALSILVGVILGNIFPTAFNLIARLEYAHVNLVIAILIWLMIYPMMIQIDFNSIKNIRKKPQGLALTIIVNWLIKPFSMALLGWLFFHILFVQWIHPNTANEYIAGMILLGVAPCTAMVFIWSQLTQGDPNYTLVQVSINDIIMIFAFAPIAALLLGISNVSVPWKTLLFSVALYVVLPLIAGLLTRYFVHNKVSTLVHYLKPFSILGLLTTISLLFAFQAPEILKKPQDIFLIAIPLIIQSYFIFFITYYIAQRIKLPHNIAAPSALIGTSNFFELAVAVAISLFGLHSGATLATVVGVLIEVPVMLTLVKFSNNTRHWFQTQSNV